MANLKRTLKSQGIDSDEAMQIDQSRETPSTSAAAAAAAAAGSVASPSTADSRKKSGAKPKMPRPSGKLMNN